MEEYKKKIDEVLQTPLTTDSPEQLYKEAALIESLAFLSVKLAAKAENEIANLEENIRTKKAEILTDLSGTQFDKTIKLEAELAKELAEIEKRQAQMKYWKSVGKLIENKVSLAQSILSNITSQIKANLYFEDIK